MNNILHNEQNLKNEPKYNNITSSLNEAQKEAVLFGNGPLLIIAGAGSGKTKVLTHRIAKIIQDGFDASNILAVTFTNKAAKEMSERVKTIIDTPDAKNLWIGTFHSVCGRILRHDINKLSLKEGERWTRNFVIYDESDSVSLLKKCIEALDLDKKIYVPKNIKSFISNLKMQGYDATSFATTATNYRDVKISEIFDLYQKELAKNNGLDFDDLILYTTKLLEQNDEVRSYYHNRFRHVLVDEFQDTNSIQYELIRLIVEGTTKNLRQTVDKNSLWDKRGVTVVGDVDQSIYSWRGADYKIILGFKNDFPENKLVKLEKNYRSTANILKAADQIIKNNKERIEKVLIPTKDPGEKIVCFEADDEREESEYIAKESQRLLTQGFKYSDIGVLYRTNAQSRAIEESLIKKNIPYQIIGGFRFYDRKEIKDLIAYLKVIYNPSDSISLKRIINTPKRGLGATTITKIENFADQNSFTLYRTLIEIKDVPGISEKVIQTVKEFVDLIESFRLAAKSLSVGDLLDHVLRKSGYWEELESEGSLDSEDRQFNLQELFTVGKEFDSEVENNLVSIHLDKDEINDYVYLGEFLNRVSLYSDMDNLKQTTNKITLMTMHLAKGLEYPIVFISGLEEGIMPHFRAIESVDEREMEEERRLMYVSVTRAKEILYFTYAANRRIFGQSEYSQVSRFIGESPKNLLKGYYGGLDQKSKSSKDFVSKKNIIRKYSEYETQEQIPLKGQSVTNIRGQNSGLKSESFKSSLPSQSSKLNLGDKVFHERFGNGIIEQLLGSGEKTLLNINFENGGKKLLDPKYAKLIKMD